MRAYPFVCCFAIASLVGGSAIAEEVAVAKSITSTKDLLAGSWLLVGGDKHAKSDTKTVWKISRNGEIKDSSSPERDIKYKLVGTEEGMVWMMILPYGPGTSGPMVMGVTVDKSTLTLSYVDIGSDGCYGPMQEGAIQFKREPDQQSPGDANPAEAKESKPGTGGKP